MNPQANDLRSVLAEMRAWRGHTGFPSDRLNQWADRLSALPHGGGGEAEHVRKLVGKLDQWRKCMSHNESYFGEPAGLVKSVVEELAHAVDPIYPPMPEPVNPLAGVSIYTSTTPLTSTAPPPQPRGDMVLVPREILDRFPEINPSNYDHDNVCRLNDWGAELVLAAAPGEGSGE